MFKITNQGVLIFSTVLLLILLYQLAPILTPFLLGALLAYLLNPLVERLDKWGSPHLLSVIVVFLLVLIVIAAAILMLLPVVQDQILTLLVMVPQILSWLEDEILPWLKQSTDMASIKEMITSALPQAGWILKTMLHSSYQIMAWIVNIILTPIVLFYALRDWDEFINAVRELLPSSIRPTVVKLTKQCDAVLTEFFRGQLLLMIALMLYYSIALTLAGLNVGLMIGLLGGLLAIVPYLGTAFIIVTATVTAYIQFGSLGALTGVIIAIVVGQSLESYVLTPYLVGKRIGLHPVAVIFAILAGGALFGFFGVLVALPVSAVIKVLLQYFRRKYIPA